MLKIRPCGNLDYLSWQTNNIELFYDDGEIVLAPVAQPDADVRSPQMCFVRDKKLRFQRHTALWRIYPKLLAQDETVKLPAVVKWLTKLSAFGHLDERYAVQPMATGMLAIDTKPIFFRQEFMPFPLPLVGSRYRVQILRVAVEKAEGLAVALRNALNILARHALLFAVALDATPAQAQDCTPSTVAHSMGLEGRYAGQFDLAEYEEKADCTLEFQQNPLFDEAVAGGDLPAVEDRLPVDALVVQPYDNIGV